MWYENPVMVVLVSFVVSGMGYLGYRFAKIILEWLS